MLEYKYKCRCEDFRVNEILNIVTDGGNYNYYILKKKGFRTVDVIDLIAEKNLIELEDISYAGLKDEDAITLQYIAIKGRKINTLTYNGLKIASDVISEKILKYLRENNYEATRCFCFNYPGRVNHIVCFIDSAVVLEDSDWEVIHEKILKEYHINICDYWCDKYEGHGIGKIVLPDIIKKYDDHLKERG